MTSLPASICVKVVVTSPDGGVVLGKYLVWVPEVQSREQPRHMTELSDMLRDEIEGRFNTENTA